MKHVAIIFLLLISGCSGCEITPCAQSYDSEPYFHLVKYKDIKVYYEDKGRRTKCSVKDGSLYIPIDMNRTSMTFEIYTPYLEGEFILNYSLETFNCESGEYLLRFSHVSVDSSSTFKEVYIRAHNYYSWVKLDTLENAADYFYGRQYNTGPEIKIH